MEAAERPQPGAVSQQVDGDAELGGLVHIVEAGTAALRGLRAARGAAAQRLDEAAEQGGVQDVARLPARHQLDVRAGVEEAAETGLRARHHEDGAQRGGPHHTLRVRQIPMPVRVTRARVSRVGGH